MLLTVGHGTLTHDALVALLRDAHVRLVVDVRRFPGSRRDPDVARGALAVSLPAAGVAYRWDERLGGRRSGADGDTDAWWRVAAFRAYAAWTRAEEFRAGMATLLADVAGGPDDAGAGPAGPPDPASGAPGHVAVMCSETVWWRCHRRVVSDVAVLLHGLDVQHLAHDGRLSPHPPSAGARVTPDGLVWDG